MSSFSGGFAFSISQHNLRQDERPQLPLKNETQPLRKPRSWQGGSAADLAWLFLLVYDVEVPKGGEVVQVPGRFRAEKLALDRLPQKDPLKADGFSCKPTKGAPFKN